MAISPVATSTNQFLMRGGAYELPLMQKYDSGELQQGYVYREYPKMLRLNAHMVEEERTIDLANGQQKTVMEKRMVYDDIIVASEDEEERVLSGGKTSAQLEEERQGLLVRCANMNIAADPSWSAVRLRRLLGDALDAPAPDEMGALKAKMAALEEMVAMKAKIAELEAQLSGKSAASEEDELRASLSALGVEVDMRWSVRTLRAKLEAATAPGEMAA
jgi:hypothetical protein